MIGEEVKEVVEEHKLTIENLSLIRLDIRKRNIKRKKR